LTSDAKDEKRVDIDRPILESMGTRRDGIPGYCGEGDDLEENMEESKM
jgi:hypothetical protein